MLTLAFGMLVSKCKVIRSLDLCLIAKETTGYCEQGFVFKHVYTSGSLENLVTTILNKIDLVYVWAVRSDSMKLNRFNKVLSSYINKLRYYSMNEIVAGATY